MRRAWPADMMLTLEPRDRDALTLLFIREAWQLEISSPPPLIDPPATGRSGLPPGLRADEAVRRWEECWTALGSSARLRSSPGSIWHDRYDEKGIDTRALRCWRDALIPPPLGRLADQPERRVGAVIVEAWRRGLRHVIELPVEGVWSESRGATLLLSRGGREDIPSYRVALERSYG